MPDALVTAAVAFSTVVAGAVAGVVAVAWRRDRRPRFAVLTVAFALLFAKGLALSWGLRAGRDGLDLLAAGSVVDGLALAALYVALVKR